MENSVYFRGFFRLGGRAKEATQYPRPPRAVRHGELPAKLAVDELWSLGESWSWLLIFERALRLDRQFTGVMKTPNAQKP
jgi:hypothetical protein